MFNATSVIEWALAYVARGWPVFPLHTPDRSGICSCPRRETCTNVGKHPRTPHGFRDASIDKAQVGEWWNEWPEANIGIVTGASSGLIVLDVDPRHGGDAALRQLIAQHGELPKQLWVRTGGGGWHIFFAHPGERIRNTQQSQKLGAGLDVRGDGGYIVAPPSLHQSGARYQWGTDFRSEAPPLAEWLLARLTRRLSSPDPHSRTCFPSDKLRIITEGLRNVTLTSLAGSLRRRGMSEEAIFAALRVENERCCQPPLAEREVRSIARSIARYQPEQFNFGLQITDAVEQSRDTAGSGQTTPPEIDIRITPWPAAPANEAFHGLAGEIVRLIEPHSEADPVALLAQTLVAFGNTVGRNAHFVAEDDRHYLNLFAVMVGATSKGRKGTSWSRIRSLFESVDELWTLERVQSGLSSGEGLIWAVRDPVEKREPIREKGVTKDYQTITTDQGVSDKRLLAMEAEWVRLF